MSALAIGLAPTQEIYGFAMPKEGWDCSCWPAPVPWDQVHEVNPRCPQHGHSPLELFDITEKAAELEYVSKSSMAIMSLVHAGWRREGSGWTHPRGNMHVTQAEAYTILLWEEGALR